MSTLKLKKLFAGKFCVMSDGTADAEQVFGPATMGECQTWLSEREGSPQPAAASPPEANEAPTRAQLRAWDAKVSADLRAPLLEEEEELRALFAKRRKPDEVDYLLRTIKTFLLSGIDGGRRERKQYIQTVRPAAA